MSLPCPECGGDRVTQVGEPEPCAGVDYYEYECQDCGCLIPVDGVEFKQMREDCGE